MARKIEFDRDEVLDKAMNLFWAKGYEATSLTELEQGLGINKFSIYNTFGNKRALYLASLARYEEQMFSQLLTTLAGDVDGLAAIERSLDFLEQTMQQYSQQNGCFMLNAGTELSNVDSDVSHYVQSMNRKLEDAFYQALSVAQQRNEISATLNLQEFARFMLTLYQGMVTVAKVEQDVRTSISSIRFVKQLLHQKN
ncbi:Transcriptional regulator, AcrR family [hydrothermal vent metagenome]|uniref:Transcriptional regulator, AcrR family n=1 Tax=hydrothermal vent metagenome TaxID=652676 RepID=A0A3B1A7J9_9ZZZZ